MSQDSSTPFSLFTELPVELRLMIWESVPQPTCLIGQTPCSACSGGNICKPALTQVGRRLCVDTRHPDWRLRYIVLSPEHAIFPPLHACRESRGVWLPRYFRPPRYLSLRDYGYEPDECSGLPSYNIRVDVPFISYETDVFTLFQPWAQADVDIGGLRRTGVDRYGIVFDPFLSLDRSRLQQIAIGEGSELVVEAAIKLDLKSLPSLRKVFVLCFWSGSTAASLPDAATDSGVRGSAFDCDLYHIPDHDIAELHILRYGRFHHPRFGEPAPLRSVLEILKALLWHAQHTALRALPQEEFEMMLDFKDYVLHGSTDDSTRTTCPFRHVPDCGPTGHTHNDMVSWVTPFTISCMMLYHKYYAMDLDGLPLFHAEMPEDEWEDQQHYRKARWEHVTYSKQRATDSSRDFSIPLTFCLGIRWTLLVESSPVPLYGPLKTRRDRNPQI
ncbi:uncharacterized protein B0T15DRAFT_506314 [Chaetomium strumarium]|uniref:2EXR domain-containing protein n=1 Tax=Chaetomium strumarium TaxID=1170767 RepID=A0AAJ0M5E3_9PEZI|nr:hypothetical protein B0T15DRAFT_506314 [Chaetomium strumarium]